MRLTTLCAVLVLVTSCSVPLGVTLYNNTDSELRVSALGVDVVVEPRASQDFEIIGGFVVAHGGIDLHYPQPFVPGEYYERYKLFRHRIRVQFEPDARLVLVKPGESFPVASDILQPEDFPLSPETTRH